MGDLSLWTLGAVAPRRLGLGAGPAMGAGLGLVAHQQGLRRLGALAAGSPLRSQERHPELGRQLLRHWPGPICLRAFERIWRGARSASGRPARAKHQHHDRNDERDADHFREHDDHERRPELRRTAFAEPATDRALSIASRTKYGNPGPGERRRVAGFRPSSERGPKYFATAPGEGTGHGS